MRCTLAEPRPRPIFDADIGADGDTDADTDFGEFKRTRRCSCSIDVARPGARSRWAHHGFRRVRHVDLAALHARPAARSTSRHRSEARGSSAAGGRERNIAEANQRVGKDRRNRFRIGLGSAAEVAAALDVAVALGYLGHRDARQLAR
jgi:hypothetical protein